MQAFPPNARSCGHTLDGLVEQRLQDHAKCPTRFEFEYLGCLGAFSQVSERLQGACRQLSDVADLLTSQDQHWSYSGGSGAFGSVLYILQSTGPAAAFIL